MRVLWRMLTGSLPTAIEAGGDDRLPRVALWAGPRRLWQAAQVAFLALGVCGIGLMWLGIVGII